MMSIEASQSILNRESRARKYSSADAEKLRDVLTLIARVHLDMIRKQNGKKNK